METQLALQPCRLSPEILQEPLPFDLYSGGGTLLLRQGTRLRGDAETLLAHSLFRTRPDTERDEGAALRRFESLFQRYGQLTEGWSCTFDDVSKLKQLATELADLCVTHSDICVCMATYLPGRSHATRHSFATAIVAVLLGNALGWDNGRLQTLVRAALTMNLSLLSHHDDWAAIRGPLSEFQKINVRRHPGLSADQLSQSPGTDLRWITAVDQHHENLDGSGYPLGLKGDAIEPEARLLRIADTWCALVLHRPGRAGKTPRQALDELSGCALAILDHPMFVALKKLMGAYPPGTFIRLANRETALVVRWDRHGTMPRYALSIIASSGQMMQQFKLRNLSQYGFGIFDYTQLNLAQMNRLPWLRVWSSD